MTPLTRIIEEVGEIARKHDSYAYRFVYQNDHADELRARRVFDEAADLTEVRVTQDGAVELHPCNRRGDRIAAPTQSISGVIAPPRTLRDELEPVIRSEERAAAQAALARALAAREVELPEDPEPEPEKKRRWFRR